MLFSCQTLAHADQDGEHSPCSLRAPGAARSRYPTAMSASGMATIRKITAGTLLPTLAPVAQSTHMPLSGILTSKGLRPRAGHKGSAVKQQGNR